MIPKKCYRLKQGGFILRFLSNDFYSEISKYVCVFLSDCVIHNEEDFKTARNLVEKKIFALFDSFDYGGYPYQSKKYYMGELGYEVISKLKKQEKIK